MMTKLSDSIKEALAKKQAAKAGGGKLQAGGDAAKGVKSPVMTNKPMKKAAGRGG
jgi:hypothetical protein